MALHILKIFTRYPTSGSVKTRLVPALGGDGASALHERMTAHTLSTAYRYHRRRESVLVEICFDGAPREKMERWLGPGHVFIPQGKGDLGRRMGHQFERELADSPGSPVKSVVIIGSDCPGITPHLLDEAFRSLRSHDLVLGPASDGGYYLIGLRRLCSDLFHEIKWGTGEVFNSTMAAAKRLGLSVHCLPMLRDVDRPEDLPAWEAVHKLKLHPDAKPQISVIIPTLNESVYLPRTLLSLEPKGSIEAIVVDGGSHDGTADIAATYGARVLQSPAGRAVQMNAGAKLARAPAMLFLHGDCELPPGFDTLAGNALKRPGVVAGAFSLHIAGRRHEPGLRFINWTATIRSRWFQMPYGDQGLFMRSDTFRALNGFPEVPILEDYLLVKALKRRGRIVTLDEPVVTSARRWHQHGVLRLTLLHQAIMLGHYLGVSPEHLARWRGRR